MMSYTFLLLCVLLFIPTIFIHIVRKDLRSAIQMTVLYALPFGFTEFLFYPTYWEPKFLFDLADKIGFGIEDFMYVGGLGGLFVSLYPFFFNLEYSKKQQFSVAVLYRALIPVIAAFFLTGILAVLKIPMIWGCIPVMLAIALAICIRQKALFVHSIMGACICAVIYLFLCLLLEVLIPNTFTIVWHAEKYSNMSLFSIPLEEITYAFSAGTVATIFYPYVFSISFVKRSVKR